MRFFSATGSAVLLFVSAGFLLHSCVRPRDSVPAQALGAWPPTSSACMRNASVDLYSIGAELTRVHADPACVAQIAHCNWTYPQTETFDSDAVGAVLWEDLATRPLSIAEQDDVVSRARSRAHLLRKPGRILHRLTFGASFVTGGSTGNPTGGKITVEANYGTCRYSGPVPSGPTNVDDPRPKD